MTLVSDESLAELWLDDAAPAPPSLSRGDPGTGVLAVGSLSKSVWGGLRAGWVRADRELVRRMAFARGSQDVGGPVLDQLLAARVFAALDALLPGRRALLRERRDALLAALAAERPAWRAARPAGGMSLWVELPEATPAAGAERPRAPARRARRAGLALRRRRRLRPPRPAALHPAARAPRRGRPPARRGRGRAGLPHAGRRAARALGGLTAVPQPAARAVTRPGAGPSISSSDQVSPPSGLRSSVPSPRPA